MVEDQFEILVRINGKAYRMQVFKVYDDDELEHFKVVGGQRSIVLQSNRQHLIRIKSKAPINWVVLEGDLGTGSDQAVAEALNKIIIEIELKILKW